MNEPKTFREAYDILQRHAQVLRNADEPNIDDLLSVVTESVAAYKVCKERIDAVELALKEALADVGTESSPAPGAAGPGTDATTSSARPAARLRPAPPATDGADDDVPF